MCSCDALFTCSRCRGTRLAPDYLDPGIDVLGFDPYNDQLDDQRPSEYEVVNG